MPKDRRLPSGVLSEVAIGFLVFIPLGAFKNYVEQF
jgi:hypothetical protein